MPAQRVTFGPGVTVTHSPGQAFQPPATYPGVVGSDGVLRTTSGGYTIAWTWDPVDEEWERPNLVRRLYYNDGTYQVWQGSTPGETGTWTAVGGDG